MKQLPGGFSAWPAICAAALFAGGCAKTGVTPGSPRSVAQAAAAAYVASGHRCEVKAELAYCDMTGSDLPLLMGYNPKTQELMFATVFDTEAAFGRSCPTIPADQVLRPDWMTVKCDEVEFADTSKKVVLSVVGGGRIPDLGLSRAELNRSASVFMQEAEGYLGRLKASVAHAQTTQRTKVFAPPPQGSTRL